MVVYKLYYFDARGRGEYIRQLLVLAGQKYEDKRVDPINEWPQLKKEMPFGQIPVLEVDGVKLAQSVSIARFLGHQFNMAGKTAIENAELDAIADTISDAMNADGIKKWGYVIMGKIEADKAQYFKEKVEPNFQMYAGYIEKLLLENKDGLLLGENPTWVDIFAAEFFSKLLDYGQKDCLDAYPHIKKFVDRIHNLPPIRNYLKKRPETSF